MHDKRRGRITSNKHTHLRCLRVPLVLSASARATPPSAPSLLPLNCKGSADEHKGEGKVRTKHSLEVREGGVGLERLCKGYPSLVTKVVVAETAREGR